MAVGYGILRKQQEIAEYDEVRDEQSRVGMLEVVTKVSLVQQLQL
jgi:hypothetical protein